MKETRRSELRDSWKPTPLNREASPPPIRETQPLRLRFLATLLSLFRLSAHLLALRIVGRARPERVGGL